jgi:hypothetical protein
VDAGIAGAQEKWQSRDTHGEDDAGSPGSRA